MKIFLNLLAVIFVTLPLKMNAGIEESLSQGSGHDHDDSYTTILTKLKGKENRFELDSGEERSILERDSARQSSFFRLDRTPLHSDQWTNEASSLAFNKKFISTTREIDEETCLNEMSTSQDENATCLANILRNNEGIQLVLRKVTDRTTWGIEVPVKVAN